MKRQQRLIVASAGFMILSMAGSADAALVSRLGGLAYYDTNTNLTWLADANAAVGSSYDTYDPGSGIMNWSDANAWAASLNVGGVTGWRLPDSIASCSRYDYCAGSEMGNLFYNVFGGTAQTSIATSHNSNYDLFSNVQLNYYWSATEHFRFHRKALSFHMGTGGHYMLTKVGKYNAWAVRTGDVSAVPVPAAAWLFGSGLIGLVSVARRKKA